MRLPRILVAIVVLLLVAAGGYTGYWFLTANRLQAGLTAWADKRRTAGYDVHWSKEDIAGFPRAFRIALSDATFARGDGYRISLPTISGTASPWDIGHWQVAAPQGGTATIQGIDAQIVARSLTGSVAIGVADTQFDVSIVQLGGAGATAGELSAEVTVPRRPPQTHRDVAFDATVQLFHLKLPKPVRALGDTIETLLVRARLMGGLPPGGWSQSLRAWRDDGGTIELAHGGLQWGALQLEAEGSLALDANLQPIGAMTAGIVDYPALLDAAVEAGMLPKKNLVLVKLVLDLLAKPGADGKERLTAPVTVQNSMLSIGRARIGRIPTIVWK